MEGVCVSEKVDIFDSCYGIDTFIDAIRLWKCKQ